MLRAIPTILLAFNGVAFIAAGRDAAKGRETERVFYVAPETAGDGGGSSRKTAASFRNADLWSQVQQSLQTSPVSVVFLDGQYVVSAEASRAMPPLQLTGLGNQRHQLTIRGISSGGAVFVRRPDDAAEGLKGPGLLAIDKAQNLAVRHLHFTGKPPIGYATHFGGKNLLIEGCSWVDLPGVYYGATGTAGSGTDHVTYRDCIFKRVGSGGHAHMAYNAYDPKHIRFVNCYFEDCAGDYVRFRDGTDFGVVVGCTFKSTGTYRNVNMPFITVPLFNDDDPSEGKRSPNYEYFGTHFLICNNTFVYANDKPEGVRTALLFHHSGFDPPGRKHLLTPAEARILEQGAAAEKRALMLRNFGIDAKTVHFFGNRFAGVDRTAAYRSGAAYGAASKGWSGIVDISDALNCERAVGGAEEALKFFDGAGAQ